MLAKWIILQPMTIHMNNSEFLWHQKVGVVSYVHFHGRNKCYLTSKWRTEYKAQLDHLSFSLCATQGEISLIFIPWGI